MHNSYMYTYKFSSEEKIHVYMYAVCREHVYMYILFLDEKNIYLKSIYMYIYTYI